jgi:hypothetical protein
VSARERHWFWATLPSKTFLSAIAADALTGTVLTFVGLPGLRPLPWWQTLAIFAYAMISCLLVNDALKVAMIKWRVPNTVAKKPEAKGEPKPDAKTKTPSDLTPQIATRAYELYEQQGRRDGQSVQNWVKAEREIRKDQAKAEPNPEAKAESQPEAKAEIKPETKVEPKPEAKGEPKSESKADAKPEAKPEPKTEPTPEVKPEAKVEPPSDLTPQLIKRVHKLYEELGREDVRVVQELERAKQEMHKDEPQK